MTDTAKNRLPVQRQPAGSTTAQAAYTGSVHRKVAVEGSGGEAATVVVIAQRGQVWVSIIPPFTGAAIMESGKVDEMIHTLALARDDAKKMGRNSPPRVHVDES
jgi:hypothetical protein